MMNGVRWVKCFCLDDLDYLFRNRYCCYCGSLVTHGWWDPKNIYAPLRSSKISVLEMIGCTSKMSLPFLIQPGKTWFIASCVVLLLWLWKEIGEASKV